MGGAADTGASPECVWVGIGWTWLIEPPLEAAAASGAGATTPVLCTRFLP